MEISTGKTYAVKIIQTRDEEMIVSLRNEFNHICKLKHENVIKVYELIIDPQNATVHLIMELFDGKELFILLSEIGHYSGMLRRRRC